MKINDDVYIQFSSIQRQYCSICSNQDVLQKQKPRAPEHAQVARNNLTERNPEQDQTQMLMAGWVSEDEKGRKRRRTGTCIIHANILVMILLSCRCGSKTEGVSGTRGQCVTMMSAIPIQHVAFPLIATLLGTWYMVLFVFHQRCEVLF